MGTEKKLVCNKSDAMPQNEDLRRVKFVLTVLQYEPVSVFDVINCDCQFSLQVEE